MIKCGVSEEDMKKNLQRFCDTDDIHKEYQDMCNACTNASKANNNNNKVIKVGGVDCEVTKKGIKLVKSLVKDAICDDSEEVDTNWDGAAVNEMEFSDGAAGNKTEASDQKTSE
ncbi:hypothetical protein Sjap_003701 [Stephania japonica]|uniref:Uncharacterized protein n=1 Tax=Stephania japonica TaxID=461633 RepID=A0AAP0PXG1_9MAGN